MNNLILLAAERAAATPRPDINSVSMWKAFLSDFEWRWFVTYAIESGATFLAILLGLLFFRRWNNPRLGLFLFTAATILVRIATPNNAFWKVLAPAGAVLSFAMFFILFRERKFVMLKEPTYYLLNGFSLVLMSFPVGGYTVSMAVASLAVSIFFILTKRPTGVDKFKGRDADPVILESLEKRANRRW